MAGLIFPLALLFTGWIAASALAQEEKKSWPEMVALSLGLGAGYFGFGFFLLSWAGLRPGWFSTALLTLPFLFSARRLGKNRKLTWPSSPPLTPGESLTVIPALGVISLGLLAAGLVALNFPFMDGDAFLIWGLKGKILATESLTPRPAYFSDVTLSYSHLDYPLLLPFLYAAQFGIAGLAQEKAAMSLAVVFYASMGAATYAGLRWKLRRTESAALTAMMMSLPMLVHLAGGGLADIPLAFFHVQSVFYLLKHLDQRRASDLWLAAIFSACGAWTKNEGIGLALINGLVLALGSWRTRPQRIGLMQFALIFAVFFAPWWWWSRSIPRTYEDYGGKLRWELVVQGWHRISILRQEFFGHIVWWDRWSFFWLLLLFGLVAGWKAFRQRATQRLWLLWGLHIAMYGVVFLVTPWDPATLLNIAAPRLIVHLLPVSALLIGCHWASFRAEFMPSAKTTL